MPVILVGCSAGAAIALECLLRCPERIKGLILISPAVYTEGVPQFVKSVFNTKIGRSLTMSMLRSELGDFMLKKAWSDLKHLTPAIQEGYKRPMQLKDWGTALFELNRQSKPLKVFERIHSLTSMDVPLMIVHGEADRIVPRGEVMTLSAELAKHQVRHHLVFVGRCGHLPHEEAPQDFVENVTPFFPWVTRHWARKDLMLATTSPPPPSIRPASRQSPAPSPYTSRSSPADRAQFESTNGPAPPFLRTPLSSSAESQGG